ncbi:hypothetical protein [Paenibacillus sp. NPDC058071]|uniref:hypothetical protein n=1 Tax=Paenibacillus sp. NPDC058071 TaxID=3346326 RepID=UPI0036D7A29B
MISVMDRTAALEDLLVNHLVGGWQQDFVAINERYLMNKERIDRILASAFEEACCRAEKLQKQGRKGEIHYIHFSYLRTSFMEQRAEYRIDLYDADWYMDREECCSLWPAEFLFKPVFERQRELEKHRVQYARKITAMDIEHIIHQEAMKYHLLAIEYIRDRVPVLIESEGYAAMKKSEDLIILAGEFRDQHELLYPDSGSDE